MNKDLIERVLIQLQPELAQEFGYAVLEDRKKLKVLEIIKEKKVDTHCLKNSADVEIYNDHKWSDCLKLDKNTFNLLKEVLL